MNLTWYKHGGYFRLRLLPVMVLLCLFSGVASAQESYKGPSLAVKTNALYWATTTPNIGFEVGLEKETHAGCPGGLQSLHVQRQQEVEALACAARTALVDLRKVQRAFLRCACSWGNL